MRIKLLGAGQDEQLQVSHFYQKIPMFRTTIVGKIFFIVRKAMESCVVCFLEKQRYQQNPIQSFHAPRGATLRTTLLRAFHPPHLGEWRPLAVEERGVSWEEFTHLENRGNS